MIPTLITLASPTPAKPPEIEGEEGATDALAALFETVFEDVAEDVTVPSPDGSLAEWPLLPLQADFRVPELAVLRLAPIPDAATPGADVISKPVPDLMQPTVVPVPPLGSEPVVTDPGIALPVLADGPDLDPLPGKVVATVAAEGLSEGLPPAPVPVGGTEPRQGTAPPQSRDPAAAPTAPSLVPQQPTPQPTLQVAAPALPARHSFDRPRATVVETAVVLLGPRASEAAFRFAMSPVSEPAMDQDAPVAPEVSPEAAPDTGQITPAAANLPAVTATMMGQMVEPFSLDLPPIGLPAADPLIGAVQDWGVRSGGAATFVSPSGGPVLQDALLPPQTLPAFVEALASKPDGKIELTLSPAELGRVRVEMVPDGDLLRVTLSIERPETLDLLRRHADQLLSDLVGSGFAGAQLGFGGWGTPSDHPQDQPETALAETSPVATQSAPPPARGRLMPPGATIDLRL